MVTWESAAEFAFGNHLKEKTGSDAELPAGAGKVPLVDTGWEQVEILGLAAQHESVPAPRLLGAGAEQIQRH